MQSGEQPIPRAVAGEQPPGAVAPVRGWRQPDDQQPGSWITQRWHRASPIGLIGVGCSLPMRHLLTPGDEPRARPADTGASLQGG